jgi:CRP-like cAMP-binding protein
MTIEADTTSLKELQIFSKVESKRLKLLAMMSERLTYAKGQHIVREGETPSAAYIVISGEVEVSRNTPCGQLHALSLGTGALFGDVPLLSNETYLGNATATTDVTVLRLGKDLFLEMIETVPEFAIAVIRDIASRLYQLTAQVLDVDRHCESQETV